jgi:hypothetical protein
MTRWLLLLVQLFVLVLVDIGAPAFSQTFAPARDLKLWYTDRTPIDIEVVGSTSLLPDSHRLLPEHVLRFRLERAFVQTLTAKTRPGFEIVSFAFDMPTGVANALIVAASQSSASQDNQTNIPVLSQSERAKRSLRITLQSDRLASALEAAGENIGNCAGATVEPALRRYEYEGKNNCTRPSRPTSTRYVANYDGKLSIVAECRDERFEGRGCSLRFPFEGFAPRIAFHRDHLPKWRDVVGAAEAFLSSKKYR